MSVRLGPSERSPTYAGGPATQATSADVDQNLAEACPRRHRARLPCARVESGEVEARRAPRSYPPAEETRLLQGFSCQVQAPYGPFRLA